MTCDWNSEAEKILSLLEIVWCKNVLVQKVPILYQDFCFFNHLAVHRLSNREHNFTAWLLAHLERSQWAFCLKKNVSQCVVRTHINMWRHKTEVRLFSFIYSTEHKQNALHSMYINPHCLSSDTGKSGSNCNFIPILPFLASINK